MKNVLVFEEVDKYESDFTSNMIDFELLSGGYNLVKWLSQTRRNFGN